MSAPAYTLRDCEVHVASREVVRAGAPQPIEPRAFDVLVYLIEQRGRVVPKDELLREVWRRVAVSDSVVAHTVRKARLAIGDVDPDTPLIRTVLRVGYHFVGRVEVPADAGQVAVDQVHDVAPALQLALLPFENRTGRPDMDWLELGLMLQVASALAGAAGLRLAPLASVLGALDAARSGDAAARAQAVRSTLGVALAVHVTVRASPQHGHELTCTIHAEGSARELPALFTASTVDMVARLAALLRGALLPHEGGAAHATDLRFTDSFSAEAHARAPGDGRAALARRGTAAAGAGRPAARRDRSAPGPAARAGPARRRSRARRGAAIILQPGWASKPIQVVTRRWHSGNFRGMHVKTNTFCSRSIDHSADGYMYWWDGNRTFGYWAGNKEVGRWFGYQTYKY